MVRQKIRAWMRDKKRSHFQKMLNISEQQADELLSILSLRPHSHRRLKSEDTQALQQILSKYEFEPAALEFLVENRLQEIKLMLDAKAQSFAAFAGGLDQTQRIALSEMMAFGRHKRRRCFGV